MIRLKIKKEFQKGQALVELILTIGIMAIILPALFNGFLASRQGKAQQGQRMEAIALLKETEQAVKFIRTTGWTNFASFSGSGALHTTVSGNSWTLTSGSQTTSDGITQQVVVSNVNRDTNGTIVTSGGTSDPSTKKVDITISWSQPYASSITTTLYFTHSENITYSETTQTQFNAGTKTGVAVSSTTGTGIPDDGQVQLSTGGGGNNDWCNPILDTNTLDLPKNGVATGMSATLGNAYVGTGENSSGVSFAKVNVSSANPPVPSLGYTFDGYKTNGVFGETNYAYLATDNNSKEVVIMDLNQVVNGKYVEVGYFNAPGNNNGLEVFVSGNIGYMTNGSTLYTFDLSSKTGSRPQLASIALAGTGNKIFVSGSYAYVAIGGAGTELQIIQVGSGGTSLNVVGQADVNGQAARDVYINSSATRAYLATNSSSSQHELFIIDISSKTGNRPTLGSYEANGMDPQAVTLVPGNLAILVGSGGEEYQVVNTSNEANPVRCGGYDLNVSINGIQSVLDAQGNAYSYLIVAANPEFRILEGGLGGGFSASGTFGSQIFNPGYQTAFNRFVATITQPSQTTIQMQVASAAQVSGSCNGASYTYVGPNGDPAAYFTPSGNTITGNIPLGNYNPSYQNPAQCFRYKVFFSTSDTSQTPVFQDVSINYAQ